MIRALQARLRGQDDGGFALIFVLFVTTVIMIGVASVLVITAGNVVPAKRSQDTAAALAAAEAGLQRYLADLNTSCTSSLSLSAPCSALGVVPVTGTVPGTDGKGAGSYTLTLQNPTYVTDGYVRVKSVGKDASGTRTLVADFTGQPSPLAYEYSTKYETLGSSFLNSYYKGRTIVLNNGAATKVPGATSATWNATTSGAPLGTDICDQLWYDTGTSGRATLKTQRSTLTAGYDWGQTLASNPAITLLEPCEVTFSSGMTFTGPVYTQDAPYLSNSTANGSGPEFDRSVQTSWTSADSPPAPSGAPWRTFPIVGGQPRVGSSRPSSVVQRQTLAPDANPTGTICIYTGPTRITLNAGGTMTVTSPLTTVADPTADPACYGPASIASGMVAVTVSQGVGGGVVLVKDKGTKPLTGWPGTGTRSSTAATAGNSVFYLPSSAGLATSADTGTGTALDTGCTDAKGTGCAWSEVPTAVDASAGWTTNTPAAKCNTAFAATEEQNFACEYTQLATAALPTSTYAALRTKVKNDLAASLPTACGTGSVSAASTTQLTCLLTADVGVANTQGHTVPVSGDHQYVAVGGAPTTVTSTVYPGSTPTPFAVDGLFSTRSGTSASETKTVKTTTYTVNRQTYGCHTLLAIITCTVGLTAAWAGDVKQFTVTVTQTTYSAFTAGTPAISYFPNILDVTQYNNADGLGDAPGDLYVDGTVTGKVSLIAKNDLVVTGDVTTSGTGADALIARNNVRIYHPVQCTDQAAADINVTTAGYCPNDVTGLYTLGQLESGGTLNAKHPSLQYSALNAAGDRSVYGGVFALTGSMLTDNYDRGTLSGNLRTFGTVAQLHRGATGVEWAIQSTDTTRPASGYRWQNSYLDLSTADLPYVPSFQGGTTSRYWNIVSISTGG